MSRSLHSLALFLFVARATIGSMGDSTGAGSGGDTMERLLAASRQSLVGVYGYVRSGWDLDSLCRCDESSADVHCRHLQSLSALEREYCRNFLIATADEILLLNGQAVPTPFVVVYSPLFALDPYGQARPVRALTQRGPAGEIKFHYDGTKWLWPSAMVSLMTHEFGHKASFAGQYVDDNPPIGPFDYAGGGRALLDATGSAVAVYAAKRGLVPQILGPEDVFNCTVVAGQSFSSPGRSPRLYRDGSLRAYEVGVGNLPRDHSCQLSEEGGKSYLTVRLLVHDDGDCGALAAGGSRWTLLELWRVHQGEGTRKPERLQAQTFRDWSPVCEPQAEGKLVVKYEKGQVPVRFELKYLGPAREVGPPLSRVVDPAAGQRTDCH